MFKDSNNDENSIEQSRERRRKRIQMRRVLLNGAPPSEIQNQNQNHSENLIDVPVTQQISDVASSSRAAEPSLPMAVGIPLGIPVGIPVAVVDEEKPVFGLMSVGGRSRDMEDMIDVKTSLCRPLICHLRPVHFFAVFDGHGGARVAALCREKMHDYLLQELMRNERVGSSSSGGKDAGEGHQHQRQLVQQELPRFGGEVGEDELWWRRVMKRSFERMDCLALSLCACGFVGQGRCGCQSTEAVLGGSTALVAVLTPYHIVVANCGDSRAVLCRSGAPFPLSFDHKPDRPEELARISAAGGHVIFVDGARVQGILAMSRAIGDKFLKPIVTSEPDITYTKRHPEDDCLILASDGLWDVLSNEMACNVACGSLREGNPESSSVAAALLTRLALGMKSSDNVSAIVINLRRS